MSVGQRIRALRKLKGITASSMSEKLDIHVVYYRALEAGTKSISPSMGTRIASILGTSYHELKQEG